MLGIKTHTYEEAIELAFIKIEQNLVVSSWKDSMISGRLNKNLGKFIQVPKYGVLKDEKKLQVQDKEAVLASYHLLACLRFCRDQRLQS